MRSATGPGRVLAGRYRIERLLGEGAAGMVWLARDTRAKGHVWAVKELDFSHLPDNERDEAWRLFVREAAMLMQLRHECLPQVIERFQENGREYLVMERVEGPTLESVLKANPGPLPEHEVAGWGVQLCQVLTYLHELNPPIVYRDLKPANVMVGVRGPLKLVDFGIARSMNPARPGDTTAYGTPGYAPLEQYVGKATPRSDLYALGATLYQLVTARAPEEFSFRFLPARQLNPELSPEMEALLAHLLQKDQEHRPATAREVQARLEPLTRPRPWMARAMGRAAHWMAQRKRSRGPSPPSDTRLPPS